MYLQAKTTYGSLIPGSEFIRSLVRQGTISPEAARKLRWMDHYYRNRNARLTCRYSDISPKTFYRWKNRFDPYDLTTLEEESRRPRVFTKANGKQVNIHSLEARFSHQMKRLSI
jgi:hypothetical protein